MAALDIHANPEPRTRGAMPYVIELQANLLSDLNTRLVAPLAPARLYKGAIPHLNPVIDIAGEPEREGEEGRGGVHGRDGMNDRNSRDGNLGSK